MQNYLLLCPVRNGQLWESSPDYFDTKTWRFFGNRWSLLSGSRFNAHQRWCHPREVKVKLDNQYVSVCSDLTQGKSRIFFFFLIKFTSLSEFTSCLCLPFSSPAVLWRNFRLHSTDCLHLYDRPHLIIFKWLKCRTVAFYRLLRDLLKYAIQLHYGKHSIQWFLAWSKLKVRILTFIVPYFVSLEYSFESFWTV